MDKILSFFEGMCLFALGTVLWIAGVSPEEIEMEEGDAPQRKTTANGCPTIGMRSAAMPIVPPAAIGVRQSATPASVNMKNRRRPQMPDNLTVEFLTKALQQQIDNNTKLVKIVMDLTHRLEQSAIIIDGLNRNIESFTKGEPKA